MVKPDARWKTLKEFIDEATKNTQENLTTRLQAFWTNHIPMGNAPKSGWLQINPHTDPTGSGASVDGLIGGPRRHGSRTYE